MNLLYRYIKGAIASRGASGHSANWKSWCIYQIFEQMGFEIDAINWLENRPEINKRYDVVFDIGRMQHLSDGFREDTVKILFLCGSDNVKRNKAGLKRAEQASRRKGIEIPYYRIVHKPEEVYQAIEIADYVICQGNEFTQNTYPERYRDKLHMIDGVRSKI